MLNSPPDEHMSINISAYRVLFVLLMLIRYQGLNLVELNRLLGDNLLIRRGYNAETLTKYIKTLRELGCVIPRLSSRNEHSYELQENPFPIQLEPAEFLIAKKLLSLLEAQPDEQLYEGYQDFLRQLAWSVGLTWQNVRSAHRAVTSELVQKRAQWATYHQYCSDSFTLELVYKAPGCGLHDPEAGERLLLDPHYVLEQNGQLFLVGNDRKTCTQIRLSISHIQSVRQLPTKSQRMAGHMVVTFALYGRLARGYRLYPGEKLIFDSDSERQIKAKVAEPTMLMHRLLKYGTACQVLAPSSLRRAMQTHLETLLQASESSVPVLEEASICGLEEVLNRE